METIDKIKDIINKVRPFIQDDGGDLEFVKYENNIVYIKMLGACVGCNFANVTLQDGIESTLRSEIPEIEKVIDVNTMEE